MIFLVPLTGLEPVRYRYRGILSPLCLPIPPQRQLVLNSRIVSNEKQTKLFMSDNSTKMVIEVTGFEPAAPTSRT